MPRMQLQHLVERIVTLQGSRILLGDDNESNQKLVSGFLQGSGIRIDIAKDGHDAVYRAITAADDYALILMAIQLPVMDGYAASRLIRRQNKTVPIVALSDNSGQEDMARTKAAGMNAQLNIPIEREKLYQTLLRFIPARVQQADSGRQDPHAGEQPQSALPNFTHLSSEKGLATLSGNVPLYRNILAAFVKDYENLPVAELDDETLRRTIHTIKGLAANIGATALSSIAKRLNESLDTSLLPQFEQTLAVLIAEIREKLPAAQSSAESPQDISGARIQELLHNLTCAINTMQPARYTLILKELDRCRLTPATAEVYTRVKRALAEFDFAAASRYMEEL